MRCCGIQIRKLERCPRDTLFLFCWRHWTACLVLLLLTLPAAISDWWGTFEIFQSKDEVSLETQVKLEREVLPSLDYQLGRPQLFPDVSDDARYLANMVPPSSVGEVKVLAEIASGNFLKAGAELEKMETQSLNALARIYQLWGRASLYSLQFADAVQWYEKALELDPPNLPLLIECLVAYRYSGLFREGEKMASRALLREELLRRERIELLRHKAIFNIHLGAYSVAAEHLEIAGRLGLEEELPLRLRYALAAVSADLLVKLGRESEAISTLSPFCGTVRPFARNDPTLTACLVDLGSIDPTNGEALLRLALQRVRSTREPNELLLRRALEALASYYLELDNLKAAEIFINSLTRLRGADDRDDSYTTRMLRVKLDSRKGRYEEAEALLNEVYEYVVTTLGENHPYVSTILSDLGGLALEMGLYRKSARLYQASLVQAQGALPSTHPSLVTILTSLALVQLSEGEDLAPVYKYLSEAERISLASLPACHPVNIIIMERHADLAYRQGEFEEAGTYYRGALSISRRSSASPNLERADILTSYGTFLWTTGNYDAAWKNFTDAINQYKYILRTPALRSSVAVEGLAHIALYNLDYAAAEGLYSEAFQLNKLAYGRGHIATERSLQNLAESLASQGSYIPAEALVSSAISQLAAKYGFNSPLLAPYRLARGSYRVRLRKFEEAIRDLEVALEHLAGQDPILTLAATNNLASAYGETGRKKAALEARLRVRTGLDELIAGPNMNKVIVLLGICQLYLDLHDYTLARAALRDAKAMRPYVKLDPKIDSEFDRLESLLSLNES